MIYLELLLYYMEGRSSWLVFREILLRI